MKNKQFWKVLAASPPPATFDDVAKISNLDDMFQKVIGYVLGMAGIVLFVFLIIGGFKYMTSGGDPKAAEGARKTISSAITGLIIVLISYLILVLIAKFTGADVTNFSAIISK